MRLPTLPRIDAAASGDDRSVYRGRRAPRTFVRALVILNLILATQYLVWRWTASLNWAAWPLALALVIAETYNYFDMTLFALTVWRPRERVGCPPPLVGATVDVYITCYNEPVELVRATARAARAIRYPHQTYVLDDGSSPAMRAMALAEGVGYIERGPDWHGRPRHAKAGNLNNALMQTTGEFIMVFDADQIPDPAILDRTLGYFADPAVALVQTPQWFYNVPPGDPFGSQAPFFYGPIQEGKDGWNAAFFCGSNALVRREALMQVGIAEYVRDRERRVPRALRDVERVLAVALADQPAAGGDPVSDALLAIQQAAREARRLLSAGEPLQDVTWRFQQQVDAAARGIVQSDLEQIRADLAELARLSGEDSELAFDDGLALPALSQRETSPLGALAAVRQLLREVDLDRGDEAQPVIPLATISVTEDMATAMRLHGYGWRSVFHPEVLARGLAPEDLPSMLKQRLRWAQGTLQLFFRQNPVLVRGLTVAQRAMYLSTMFTYLTGPFSVVYIAAPILYFFFGLAPIVAYSGEFFARLLPYLIVNQVLFLTVAAGRPTWRGQQYSLALFPVWLQALSTAIGSVFFGRQLGFIVTPKARQDGIYLSLIKPQLIAMGLLALAVLVGLAKLVLGPPEERFAILVNIFWCLYDLSLLSVIVEAVLYRPKPRTE